MLKDYLLQIEEGQEFQEELLKIKCNVCILIFGCVIIEKYKDEIDGILNTWGKTCDSLNIPYFIFIGKNIEEFKNNEHFIELDYKDVKDDYLSASYKQYLGIQWIMSKYDPNFLYIIGSDTYVNIEEFLLTLSKYVPNEASIIGNAHYKIRVTEFVFFLHTGGAGIILSRESLNILKPYFYKFQERWTNIITYTYGKDNNYIAACDVSLVLLCEFKNIISHKELKMHENREHIDPNNFICSHFMKKKHMLEMHNFITFKKEYIEQLEKVKTLLKIS